MQDFDYNTQRIDIKLKEYGRNVQNIANHVKTIDDDVERTKQAKTLIKLMKLINPAFRDDQDNEQMMWDHLHIISDFELEIKDSPYEKPEEEILSNKPQKVEYGTGRINLRHYGKNIELIIAKIAEETDPEKQLAGISKVGKMMKKFYSRFSKNQIEDDVIAGQIEDISRGKIKVDLQEIVQDDLFYVSKAELMSGDTGGNNTPSYTHKKRSNHGSNNKNYRNNNNNKKRRR